MDNHHLAVSLPADRLTRVLNLLRKLEAELPFLIMLSDEERDAMPILDERKLAYIDRALHLVEAHPDFMPRDFGADEFGTDVQLVKALGLIHSHLLPLARKLDDSLRCAENDACRAALEVHRHASLEDPADTDSLDAMIDSLSPRRFRRCHVSNPAHP